MCSSVTPLGSRNSNVVAITIATPVADPTAAPVPGSYTGTQNVVLSCATSGATILYTENGADPLIFGTPYTTPIPVTVSLSIRAIAIKAALADSDEVSFAYVILPAPGPSFGNVLAQSSAGFPYLGAWESGGEGYTNPTASVNHFDIATGGNVHGGVGTLTEVGGDTFLNLNMVGCGHVNYFGADYTIIAFKPGTLTTPFTLTVKKTGGATNVYTSAAATFSNLNPPPLSSGDDTWMWPSAVDFANGVATSVEISH